MEECMKEEELSLQSLFLVSSDVHSLSVMVCVYLDTHKSLHTDQAFFQLQIGPVEHCTAWSVSL